MMTRCYNPKFPDYHNYGGRGIEVCAEWFDVARFVDDMTEGYKNGLQLDRTDNNGWYSKSNCKWVTRKQNNRNKRTNVFIEANGIKLTATEWSELLGIPYTTILSRKNKGLAANEILSGLVYM